MDTFVDSSWYFYRYCSPGDTEAPFDPDAVRRWMPVAQYVGGVEHAILHLLYMRFFNKVLYDLGMVDFVEPMRRLMNQGQVINQGKAMSKSIGNGVDLGEQIDAFGVDAVRLTVIFAGPPEEDIDWADVSPGRFVAVPAAGLPVGRGRDQRGRAPTRPPVTRALRRETHRLLADIDQLIEGQRFNVAVARVMELVNAARKAIDSGPGAGDPAVREATEVVTVVLSLAAPYVAEEMWELLGHAPSVANAAWPRVDPDAAGDRVRDLRRPGAGQGAGPARGAARHRRGRAAHAGPGRRGRVSGAWPAARSPRSSSAPRSWSPSFRLDG